MNIGDEYLSKGKMGHWRDTHILVKGDFANGLQKVFLHDFYTIKRIDGNSFSCTDKTNEYFPKFQGSNGSLMQIVKSGPDSEYQSIMQGILKMISIAKSNIYITTPYFVPPKSIMDALKVAALSGIDIQILFPGKYDHPTVYYASKTYLAELLGCGVKIYTYDKNAFIHSKTITIDGIISTVGTANMDIRSFELNYEINAVIYDEKIAKQLELIFSHDITSSVEMTLETCANTSKWIKCLEAIARVFSSLL
jgi:cardiolipin synthase